MKTKFKTALITGVSGSGGSYLAEYLLENHSKLNVHGLSRWHSTTAKSNISTAGRKLEIHECDLLDYSSIIRVLEAVQPDVIYHLASYANVRTAFITPLAILNNNIMGTANLFEAVRSTNKGICIQLCSTSEVYGQVDPEDVPIKESCKLRPSSPYAVSKAAQDHLAYSYWRSYQMPIIRTRMFSYFNPRRSDLFATSFALQAAEIELGIRKELLHGNLDSTRTMIDVRDAMSAYWYATEYGEPGEVYNIGGETVITVGDFLAEIKKHTSCDVPSRVDPALLRPSDVTLQIPNTEKFRKISGWKPKYSFEQSISHLMDYCRATAKKYQSN